MRYVILVASLALAYNALAEDKPKSLAKPIDQSTPVLMETAPPADSPEPVHAEGIVHRDIAARGADTSDFGMSRVTENRAAIASQNTSRSGISVAPPADGTGNSDSSGGTRAQDYNSSRSNTTALREDDATDLDGDGRPDVVTCRRVDDRSCNGTEVDTGPANHNTTRSRQ